LFELLVAYVQCFLHAFGLDQHDRQQKKLEIDGG
jgi:hypothetical protein